MLLIYTSTTTSRLKYIFKHCCTRLLGLPVDFTAKIETFVAYAGPKLSYTNKKLGDELHIKSAALLFQQGVQPTEIKIGDWVGIPAFFSTNNHSAIPYDIFAASFYLLTRYEEYLPHVKDVKGRYPARASLAYQHNFLDKPLVDIWLQRFKEVLLKFYPDLKLQNKKTRNTLLVQVHRAFAYKNVGIVAAAGGFFKDLIGLRVKHIVHRAQVLLLLKKDPNAIYKWLVQVQKRATNHKMQVYFALGDYTSINRVIRHSKLPLQRVIKMINDYCDVGLLASISSTSNPIALKEEKKRFEEISLRPLRKVNVYEGSFQIPISYQNFLEEEITDDYSMVFPETFGFRASTCSSYKFYDLIQETQTPLDVHPPCLSIDQVFDAPKKTLDVLHINKLQREIQKVGGDLILVFTNVSLAHTTARDLFKKMLLNE